jgi:hypothetical protein
MGSCLYWYIEQEGMEVAIPTNATLDFVNREVVFTTLQGDSFLRPNFNYSWGFKGGIGIGFGGDNWTGVLEYTSIDQKLSTPPVINGALSVSSSAVTAEFLALTSWFTAYRGLIGFPPAVSVASKWRTRMNMGDAYLARPFYQGRYLTVTPFAGVRGLILQQNFRLQAVLPQIPLILNAQTISSRNYSHSWGVGPRVGLKGHWMLGAGFRLEGDASGALLFTRYTKVSHVETPAAFSSGFRPHYRFRNYNTMRPVADLGIGVGWGSYLGCSREPGAYVDLSGTYDLLFLWGQNMMEKLVSNYATLTDTPPGDLHMHGVTATASLDF